MPRATFRLGGQDYATAAAVKVVVQRILHSAELGSSLPAEEFEFMLDLLARHPDAETKIGVGVLAIFAANNGYGDNRGFHVMRLDGTTTDFSFLKCLRAPGAFADFRQAAREAISPQTIEFKRRSFASGDAPVCEITGVVLTRDSAHVDHFDPTFDQLLRTFVADHGIDVESIALLAGDGSIGRALPDELRESWARYHREYARLRLVSKRANLSDLRRH